MKGPGRPGTLLLTLGLLLVAVCPVAWACPMCKETLSAQGDPALSSRLAEGYNRSILLLMSAPYLLFAGVTYLIVRATRRK